MKERGAKLLIQETDLKGPKNPGQDLPSKRPEMGYLGERRVGVGGNQGKPVFIYFDVFFCFNKGMIVPIPRFPVFSVINMKLICESVYSCAGEGIF